MADMCDHFRRFMIEGTTLNNAKLTENIDRSVMMVTALSPVIGYDKAAAISYAIDHDLALKQAALANGVSEELYDKVVVPENLTHPGGALMLRTTNPQPSLWEAILPGELLALHSVVAQGVEPILSPFGHPSNPSKSQTSRSTPTSGRPFSGGGS